LIGFPRSCAAEYPASNFYSDHPIWTLVGPGEAEWRDPIPDVDGSLIATAVPVPADRVLYVSERTEVSSVLAGLAHSGDVVITMGAGDITAWGRNC
jgi:hypothetical protein